LQLLFFLKKKKEKKKKKKGESIQIIVVWVKFIFCTPFFSLLEPANSVLLELQVHRELLTPAVSSKFIKVHMPSFSGMVQSQNHRMVWVGRDPQEHPVPTPTATGRDTFL